MGLFQHPKTTILGILTVLCSSAQAFSLIPPPWGAFAMSVCGLLTGLGLIVAADGKNVSPKV